MSQEHFKVGARAKWSAHADCSVRLSVCRLHGHPPRLVWNYLLTPKCELDLTVDLSNCVIDSFFTTCMINTAKTDDPTARVTELKFARDQGFCTTLCYVVFTDGENKIW